MEEAANTLDLSNRKLKKLEKRPQDSHTTTLILDDNELQRLDNIDSFVRLQKLSAVHNQLLRMYGVCRLHFLHTLNLAHNGILTVEGLKELTGLKWLCLAGNSIKTIEHLNTNVNLEYLDLSENSITHVNDLSFLKNLKELFLHNNRISHLRQSDRFLPPSLTSLTLANNAIDDLNEISQLAHLVDLASISIANNPCVNMAGGNAVGFDYRPFVINWCLNVKTIDGYLVDAIESLRAEWLYSQGRGRHFRVGHQKDLARYLATVCPLTGEALETEEDRKLRLILSKAQHHQQQLRDQSFESPDPSPATRRRLHGVKHNSRINSPRLCNKTTRSPDNSMSSSCYGPGSLMDSPSIMTQSLDPSILRQSVVGSTRTESSCPVLERCLDSAPPMNSPLQALSTMVPVPESLMSPEYRPGAIIGIGKPTTLNTAGIPSSLTPPPSLVNAATPQHQGLNNSSSSSSTNNKTASKATPPPHSHSIVRNSPKMPRTQASSAATAKTKTMSSSMNDKKSNSPSPVRARRELNNANSNKQREHQHHSSNKTSILRKSPSTDDEAEMCASKLQMIQMRAEEKRLQKDLAAVEVLSNLSNSSGSAEDKVEAAAVLIQKMWRGYFTRNRNKEVQEMFRTLQAQRAGQYIKQLTDDMETTKAALESERKIQMLQTEAISALWKQMSALQPCGNGNDQPSKVNMTNLSGDNVEVVKELARTCSMLQGQIQQLQGSMQDIMKVMTVFSQSRLPPHLSENGTGTQTEIVAVHTPQGEAARVFPFQKQTARPSSLPLPVQQRRKEGGGGGGLPLHQPPNSNQNPANGGGGGGGGGGNAPTNVELQLYADNLADDVIRTVHTETVVVESTAVQNETQPLQTETTTEL